MNVQRSRTVNGCDQERKTHWSRGGVNMTPFLHPVFNVFLSVVSYVMHSAQLMIDSRSHDKAFPAGSSVNRRKSSHRTQGYIAKWLEQLTADQQVPGSIPGGDIGSILIGIFSGTTL